MSTRRKTYPTHIIDCAKLVALDSGDYNETQHAIDTLGEMCRSNAQNEPETVAEIAARVLAHELERVESVNNSLCHWIREEGDRTQTCTFHILGGELCNNCQCSRKPKAP